MLSTWKIAPALAAGCTVVHKPAEWSPVTAAILSRLVKEAGVFNTRVKLTGETPKGGEDAIARRDRNNSNDRDVARNRDNSDMARSNDRYAIRNGDYERNYNTDDADDADAQPLQRGFQPRGRDSQLNSVRPYYYQERPYYRSYGRSLFFSNGW